MSAITGLRIEIAPLLDGETFTPVLTGIEHRAIDIMPAYDALYGAFRKIEQRRFSAEGPGWQPLSESTQADRARLGVGASHPILNRSGGRTTKGGRKGGALRKSLTTRGATGAVLEPQVDGIFMGTKDSVARYHQDGTSKMPARPVVDLNEGDAAVFAGIIGEYIFDYSVHRSLLGDSMFVADAMGL